MSDVERFIQVYEEIWPSFDADRLERFEMVHPEATIHHSGMEQPIRGDEEPDYVRGIKALMPDISLEMRNWAARGEVIFVEYAMEATVNGERVAWDGIGRFVLRDGRVIDAIGRWDPAGIQAALGAQRSTAG
ncbi:MAG TPA: nuclear transport factor 2 family protein [Solirubrobacterales bacterium]|nr:nuclear transport factor 2 family protein [Solirubrobacterales bacterium]